jgi:hypothetical protein
MSYQTCRWYDPYPRLAFALKLLYIAPKTLQQQAFQDLRTYLNHEWGEVRTTELLKGLLLTSQGQRWYDEDPQTAGVVELLRNAAPALKTRATEKLLGILCPSEPG